jgi:two-component system response regulator RegX3
MADRNGANGARTEWIGSERDPLVLLVDAVHAIDDPFVVALMAEEFQIMLAKSGREGLEELRVSKPALMMVNSVLPDMSGLSVLRRIRSVDQVPVILISDVGDENEAVLAFEMGADDYLYEFARTREAAARIRAALAHFQPSRYAASESANGDARSRGVLQSGPVAVDLGRHEVLVRGRLVHFRPKEYNLLVALVENAGYVVTTDRLLAELWPNGGPRDPKTLAVHVRRLRAAIEDDPAHPAHVLTIKGSGLRFDP